MDSIEYLGPFKEHLISFIELKQAIGNKYFTEAKHLKRFDSFTLEKYPHTTRLTKDIVLDWCQKRSYESQANQCSRASMLRQFGIYLDSIGESAYIIPKGYYPKEPQYVPYIFTQDELKRFFAQTEKCKYCYEVPFRHLIMPVFYRMLYMCGLRTSEARLLKVEDVDLDRGILSIHHSKKDNSRLVPMSVTMIQYCQNYSEAVHSLSRSDDFYFPGISGKPMTHGSIYRNFRKFLWRAGISHGGKGVGPRVYDFRYPNLNKIQTFFK